MNRLLVATTGALLLIVPGCTPTKEEPALTCEYASFDLSACDRSGLASVKAEGVWHANVTLSGVQSPGAIRFLADQPLLLNTPLTVSQAEGETFYVASDYTSSSVPLRLAIAGCQASSPEKVNGQFRRCSSGTLDFEGTFDAVRVRRVAGEEEKSGVDLVSETALPRGSASDVFVAGGYAYVTALSDGLFVYDVSDRAAPKKVAEVAPTGDVLYRSWVKGQTLYVSSYRSGVLIYDVSNPAAPKRLSSVPTTAVQGWGLWVDGDRLYVMSPAPDGEVLIFDISQPTTPVLLARHYVEDSLVSEGQIPVEGAVVNNRLYLGHWRYGLAVVDVSSPSEPVDVGHFGYDNATSRAVAVGTIGDRTIAFESSEGWGSRIRALDVTDPANIAEVGRFEMRPESTVGGLTLVGSKLYVAHTQDGLRVLDMSNPSTPRQVAYYNTWRESDAGRGRTFIDGLSGVKVPGDGYVYAAETSRGLLVFKEQ